MALVVEDGSGLTNANAYASVAEVASRIAAMPEAEEWEGLDTTEKEKKIQDGTAFLDLYFRYYGKPKTGTQALQWPRTKNWDNKGVLIPPGTVPEQLKQALVRVIAVWIQDPSLQERTVEEAEQVSKWALGPLSAEYKIDKKDKEGSDVSAAEALAAWNFPELDLLLRSIGTKLTEEWLTEDRRKGW